MRDPEMEAADVHMTRGLRWCYNLRRKTRCRRVKSGVPFLSSDLESNLMCRSCVLEH